MIRTRAHRGLARWNDSVQIGDDNGPRPDEDDRDLFRQAIGEVRRIHAESPPAPPRPRPAPRQRQADDAAVLRDLASEQPIREGAESGEVLSYIAPGYPRRYLRRLIRSHYVISDSIDLHHLEVQRAREVMALFLRQARNEGHFCLRIIHGKGGAKGSPLKAMVELELLRRAEVVAFHSAPANQGGTGAVDVLLRRA